jgi:hypothetical protein
MLGKVFTQWRTSAFGILSWLVPFVASIPFYSPTQGLLVPQPLFKSAMVVIGTASGVALLVWLFQKVPPGPGTGLVVGLYWMAINLVLDAVVLLPMSGMDPGLYLYDIGLRYVSLPVIAAGMGAVGRRA